MWKDLQILGSNLLHAQEQNTGFAVSLCYAKSSADNEGDYCDGRNIESYECKIRLLEEMLSGWEYVLCNAMFSKNPKE